MAFKSEAQRRKFTELLNAGKITKETYEKMAQGTPKKLPEKLGTKLKTGVRRPKYLGGPK